MTRRSYRTYDMAMGSIQRLHHLQNGCCANPACRDRIDAHGRKRSMDHDRQGNVCGLLCKPCAMALGLLLRDSKRIAGLLDYLQGNRFADSGFLKTLTMQQKKT